MITSWPPHSKQRQFFLGWVMWCPPAHDTHTDDWMHYWVWAKEQCQRQLAQAALGGGSSISVLLTTHLFHRNELIYFPSTSTYRCHSHDIPSRKATESTQGTSRLFPESQKLSSYSASSWSLTLLFCWAASTGFLSPGTNNYIFSWGTANSGKPGKF